MVVGGGGCESDDGGQDDGGQDDGGQDDGKNCFCSEVQQCLTRIKTNATGKDNGASPTTVFVSE